MHHTHLDLLMYTYALQNSGRAKCHTHNSTTQHDTTRIHTLPPPHPTPHTPHPTPHTSGSVARYFGGKPQRSINPSIHQSMNESTHQSITQSIHPFIHSSIHQSIEFSSQYQVSHTSTNRGLTTTNCPDVAVQPISGTPGFCGLFDRIRG